ncbi:ABC-type transport system, involved in lipoprotein release, permease component [Cenarchaeum symbiosum A]|uniref:ABC-type transport system, involved in lipoprotein release, permease component n=1 Tax=Cenarchaeum symbiosum (strain A) TaxID=414004 RepID=A0RXR0_CENSY|nr:ABC-type transport system, involved in lipoprotein release, permease component [Cenarchaeum symbiosum A]
MLFNKRGSLMGAVLAVTIGILVIHVNFVIFQGLFDAIVRDLEDYRFGNIAVTDDEGYIDKSDLALVSWFERIPQVEAATSRLSAVAAVNVTKNGMRIEETRIPVVGVDPLRDVRASTVHKTVTEGQFVFSRNSIVVGSSVARDLGNVTVGDNLAVKIVDRLGDTQIRRFIVTGVANSPGGQGFDYSIVMHIDTLRDMMARPGQTGQIMVRLNDPDMAVEIKNHFLASFPNDDFEAETIEEAAESQLAGFRSGIAMINMIGYFGMMSSAFAIVTIQMMLVNGKTREIGVMRAIGARRRDIMIIFLFQGMIIGAIGAGAGTAAGLTYTFYAKETKMSFNNSLPLEVSYDWAKVAQTAMTSFALAILASLYPSYRATKLLPVEAMRVG